MGVTPTYGLRWPDHATALVKDGAEAIHTLATDVEAQVVRLDAAVIAAANGFDVKASVRLATAAALPAYTRVGNVLTANANGALPNIDGVAPNVNDRVLQKNGASHVDDGIYVVTSLGSGGTPWVLTRAADADSSAEVTPSMYTVVEEGTLADTGWLLTTNAPIVLNTTALTFTQFPQPGGGWLSSSFIKAGGW